MHWPETETMCVHGREAVNDLSHKNICQLFQLSYSFNEPQSKIPKRVKAVTIALTNAHYFLLSNYSELYESRQAIANGNRAEWAACQQAFRSNLLGCWKCLHSMGLLEKIVWTISWFGVNKLGCGSVMKKQRLPTETNSQGRNKTTNRDPYGWKMERGRQVFCFNWSSCNCFCLSAMKQQSFNPVQRQRQGQWHDSERPSSSLEGEKGDWSCQ